MDWNFKDVDKVWLIPCVESHVIFFLHSQQKRSICIGKKLENSNSRAMIIRKGFWVSFG